MKNALYFVRIIGVLFLITALVAAALAGVNAVTKDRIAQLNQEKTLKAVAEVLPEVGDIEQIPFTDPSGLISKVYRPVSGNAGYAVEVHPQGFGGEIVLMVGVSPDGTVLGISVISQAETAGLGAIMADKGDKGQAFRDSYIGLSGNITVSKDCGQADTITGATISSRAVANGVNAAITCVLAMEQEAGK